MYQKGQALVILLFFMAMALTVTSIAIVANIVNSQTTTRVNVGVTTEQAAQSGAENALLRLLRNPNYTGETLTIGSGTVTVNVTGTTTKTITSNAVDGTFTRQIVVSATIANGVLHIVSWQESY